MTSSVDNIKIGVCKITYNSIDLGYTIGGVEVNVSTETRKMLVDQFGKTPVSESIMGREVKVKVPLAETTLDNLVAIMPGATKSGISPNFTVTVTDGVAEGTNLKTLAKELRLHPISKADADKTEDFVIPLAGTAGGLVFSYQVEQERVFNVEFTGYPDPTTRRLFYVGVDPV